MRRMWTGREPDVPATSWSTGDWLSVACWPRRGGLDDLGEGSATDPWRKEAPVLAGIAEASVQGRGALGERASAAVRRCGASADLLALAPLGRGPCHARGNGFDLHAPSSCRRGIGPGSNGCAATRSVLPSRPTGCT